MAGEQMLAQEIRLQPFLVAESNAALREAIVARLGAAGVGQCDTAGDGADAWRKWQQAERIGVLIATWQLPGLTGLELLKRVRADGAAPFQPAFIVMSSDESPAVVQAVVDAGGDCFVPKPFPPERLLAYVVEGVEHRKQVAGQEVFARSAMQARRLVGEVPAELIFPRANLPVECAELRADRCVIRTDHNYGLGTALSLRLRRREAEGGGFYDPVGGLVTKMERVPGWEGMYRVHIRFKEDVTARQGVGALLLGDESEARAP